MNHVIMTNHMISLITSSTTDPRNVNASVFGMKQHCDMCGSILINI
jgi:hypothetical protein